MEPYPLTFIPILKEKVWGGRMLSTLGRELAGGDSVLIGESWELADLADTSPSGGGGGAERSTIANGPLAAMSLHEAIGTFGPRLMGRLGTTGDGDFPVLVKFLDARENLSVQVHPSEAFAKAHPEAHLKSEAWYVMEADANAVIYKGVREGVTPEQFRQAIEGGTAQDLLISVPVKSGDCHYLPSGTCHALGAGILVAEVQTPSDTTFRVYDWGRTDRQLHVDQAIQCIRFGPPDTEQYEKRTHIAGMFTTVSRLVTCEHFRIEKIRMSEGYEQEMPYDQPAVWTVLKGRGTITPGNGADPVDFNRGETLLIPADLPEARIALHEDTVWLEVTFSQVLAEQIA